QGQTISGDGTPPRKTGRPRSDEKDPGLLGALERLLKDETAGDPMGEQKWVRSSLRRLSARLKEEGHPVAFSTVRQLLKKMKYSLRCNLRKEPKRDCPDKDRQFRYIASQKAQYAAAGLPIISVDTKKKELIGNFRNPGRVWCQE